MHNVFCCCRYIYVCSLCVIMGSGSALHFLPTPTLALHIKHTFVTKIDKEISVLPVFIKIVYKCSLFITVALSRSHYKIFSSNVKTTSSHLNIRLETCRKEWGPVGLVLQFKWWVKLQNSNISIKVKNLATRYCFTLNEL